MAKNGGMKILQFVTMLLLIVGGLNWGLYGLFDIDLVYSLFGASIAATVVYVLVGISAVIVALGALFMKKK